MKHCYMQSGWKNNNSPGTGPTLLMPDADGAQRNACLFAGPHANATHVLAVTCEKIAKRGPEPEMFLFYGGFDPPEIMTDPKREVGFLAFRYPLSESDKMRERVGSVDYVPHS
jgi:hypothetical protein